MSKATASACVSMQSAATTSDITGDVRHGRRPVARLAVWFGKEAEAVLGRDDGLGGQLDIVVNVVVDVGVVLGHLNLSK